MIVTLEKNKQTAQTTVVMPNTPFLLAGQPVVCYGLMVIFQIPPNERR